MISNPRKTAEEIIPLLFSALEKSPYPVIAIGNKGIEKGVVLRLFTLENGSKVLDKVSAVSYSGIRNEWGDLKKKIPTVGVGLEKTIFSNKMVQVNGDILVTQPVKDFLAVDRLNFAGGISIKF